MNLIKVKDIDDKTVYINTNAINKIKITDGIFEEKYIVFLCNGMVCVKESKEIDKMIDDCDRIDNLKQIDGQLEIEGIE